MSFLIKDDKLLKKYSKVWNEVSSNIKKGFDNKSVYIEKYAKTTIKSYESMKVK